jgi:hypothetical protein
MAAVQPEPWLRALINNNNNNNNKGERINDVGNRGQRGVKLSWWHSICHKSHIRCLGIESGFSAARSRLLTP